jgi:peptide/nickel transport system ATP-binding protein
MTDAPLLAVDALSVRYATARGALQALDAVSFAIPRGRALGLVGESGSGKSTVILALLGLLGPEATVTAARVRFQGADLLGAAGARQRGDRLAMVFQDPAAALNPALPIGLQVAEPLMVHRGIARPAALARAEALLAEVGLAQPTAIARAYPHQLSGGMKQRVLIATALACEPDLLLLDEPTTALDVTIEAQILDLLDALRARRGLSLLFVSHNLGVIDRVCDDVAVLYAGRIVEAGPVAEVLRAPVHPYTKGLLGAVPRLDGARLARLTPIPGRLPDLTRPDPGCGFRARCPFAQEDCAAPQPETPRPGGGRVRCQRSAALGTTPWPSDPAPAATARTLGAPLLETDGLAKTFRLGGLLARLDLAHVRLRPPVEIRAVDGVSLSLRAGEVLGLVGESGSGKSTVARLLLRLLDADAGVVRFAGAALPARPPASFRRRAQIVFQNPDSALNPRHTVGAAIARPLRRFGLAAGAEIERRVDALLDLVRLSSDYRRRYPHQLSGGEKQRVGIARAMASAPDVLLCDEAVSALDVSVQAAILNLFADLRDRLGVAYLFISHDISVVAHLADRLAVMYRGALVEHGSLAQVLAPPHHPYTEVLLSAVPVIGDRARAAQRLRPRGDPAPGRRGCRFAAGCPRRIGPICDDEAPPVRDAAPGHRIACHLPLG